MRDPIGWLGSKCCRARANLDGHPNNTLDISVDDFVLEYVNSKPEPFANDGSQAKFVCDGYGQITVDHLFAYEDQDQLIVFLESRLNVTLTLPHLNASRPHGPTRRCLVQRLRQN
jgi:hypothetical protein|tara:strand:+ start:1032 stop:1376 length:345 start_codon:yes stop_codon:yes gene_type:complete